jgi:hypothetical protein
LRGRFLRSFGLQAALRLFPQSAGVALHAYHVRASGWEKDEQVPAEVAAEVQAHFDQFLAGLAMSDEGAGLQRFAAAT